MQKPASKPGFTSFLQQRAAIFWPAFLSAYCSVGVFVWIAHSIRCMEPQIYGDPNILKEAFEPLPSAILAGILSSGLAYLLRVAATKSPWKLLWFTLMSALIGSAVGVYPILYSQFHNELGFFFWTAVFGLFGWLIFLVFVVLLRVTDWIYYSLNREPSNSQST